MWLPVSQWYVYSRTHITSDMCIPYPPLLQTSVDFISVVFLWILRIIIKGTTNDSRVWATYRQKGNDLRQNNRKKISLILCGPQCWCKYFFSFLSFCSSSNVIKYFTGGVKYGWRNFIQQEITRKVKKYIGAVHISLLRFCDVYSYCERCNILTLHSVWSLS